MAKTGENDNLGTAEGAVLGRAMHAKLADPVLDDHWAIHLLSDESRERVLSVETPEEAYDNNGFDSGPILAVGVGCLRYAEDQVERSAAQGVRQYGILGAGFDTFAMRRGDIDVKVFEIDHPDVQALKQARVERADAPLARLPEYVPIDFETTPLSEALGKSSFDTGAVAIFSWLNTLPYLTVEATRATLGELGRVAAKGSRLVVNYGAEVALTPAQQDYLGQLMGVAADTGEPFQSRWTPDDFVACLAETGWRIVEHLTEIDLTKRYYEHRADGLKPGLPLRVVLAERAD